MKIEYLESEGTDILQINTYAAKLTFDCGCSFSGAGGLEQFIVCAEHGDWVAGADEVQKPLFDQVKDAMNSLRSAKVK